jgi:hypothetical protein
VTQYYRDDKWLTFLAHDMIAKKGQILIHWDGVNLFVNFNYISKEILCQQAFNFVWLLKEIL